MVFQQRKGQALRVAAARRALTPLPHPEYTASLSFGNERQIYLQVGFNREISEQVTKKPPRPKSGGLRLEFGTPLAVNPMRLLAL
jgi:hypothetical protein